MENFQSATPDMPQYWFPTASMQVPYHSELMRLFPDAMPPVISAPSFTYPRQRNFSTSSGGSYSSFESDTLDSPSLSPLGSPGSSTESSLFSSPWEEFENNGHESELDELDKLMRRLNLDRNVRSSTCKPMSGRAEELLNGQFNVQNSDEDPMVIKNRLIQLLRANERSKAKGRKSNRVCVFCRNNGEAEVIYTCHTLKNEEGAITCPILYCYTCPKCGATKDNAHTLKYCPLSTGECPSKALKTSRTSAGRRRFP